PDRAAEERTGHGSSLADASNRPERPRCAGDVRFVGVCAGYLSASFLSGSRTRGAAESVPVLSRPRRRGVRDVADQRTEQRGSKPRNAADAKPGDVIETNIPARMDRLPWSRWHWLVVIALGITWVLDGLEVTIVGAIGPVLGLNQTLSLDPGQIGLVGSLYVAGTVVGGFLFGYITDRLGRKRLSTVTLPGYLLATVA